MYFPGKMRINNSIFNNFIPLVKTRRLFPCPVLFRHFCLAFSRGGAFKTMETKASLAMGSNQMCASAKYVKRFIINI